jgi:hypothetical protein
MERTGLFWVPMRTPTLTLLLTAALALPSAAVLAANVYKWVDEKGVTHYSDQPHPKAKEVQVDSAQTYSSEPAPQTSSSSSSTASASAGPPYGVCEIYRPEADETFQNTNTLTAKVRLEPQLRPGDRVAIAVDGKRLTDQPDQATEFVISEVSRGTHSLLVVIEDRQGKAVCTSPAVQFHVHQPSVQAPVRSSRPRF